MPFTAKEREQMMRRLTSIEKSVINAKIPGAYADQLYMLREHIRFVRDRLNEQIPQP